MNITNTPETPTNPTLEEQIAIMDKMRDKVLASPDHFDMSHWHSDCGTTHCMGGFIHLDADLKTLPNSVDTQKAESVATFLVPDFAKFFYGSTDKTLAWIRVRGWSLAKGQVAKDELRIVHHTQNNVYASI